MTQEKLEIAKKLNSQLKKVEDSIGRISAQVDYQYDTINSQEFFKLVVDVQKNDSLNDKIKKILNQSSIKLLELLTEEKEDLENRFINL